MAVLCATEMARDGDHMIHFGKYVVGTVGGVRDIERGHAIDGARVVEQRAGHKLNENTNETRRWRKACFRPLHHRTSSCPKFERITWFFILSM